MCKHLEDNFVPLLFVLHIHAVHDSGTTSPRSERSLGTNIVVVMADALYDYVLTLTSDIVVDDDIVLVRLGTLLVTNLRVVKTGWTAREVRDLDACGG